MEEGKRYTRLGVFVVVGFAILLGALFVLGGRKVFEPTFTFETYFDESVAGLDIGAPVRFRGVPLGQVSQVLTSAATYERDVPLERRREYIVVRAKINFSAKEAEQLKRDVVQMVNRGLRAQTQLAGVTGQQYLSIDFLDPQTHPPLAFDWTPKNAYLPSAPSMTGEIVSHMQTFLANLNETDVKALGANLNRLVVDLDQKINDAPLAELVSNANATIKRIDGILAAAPIDKTLRRFDSASARLDALLADPGLVQTVDNVAAISGRIRKLTDDGDLDRMVMHIDETTQRLDALIGDNQYDVGVIVQDLRVTADNLRTLSESVKRYPAGALVAGPPDKVRIPASSP